MDASVPYSTEHGPQFRVSDNGIGIAQDELTTVFDMFSQVNDSQSQGGLGIGLSLVKRLVELHGGTVRADSAGAGQGATFTVRLPLAKHHLEQSAIEGIKEVNETQSRTHRILVADDNIDAAETLASVLRLDGHDVQIASDGVQAVKLATSFSPDIAFLDIGMPGMNGHEAAREIQRSKPRNQIILVALTGWAAPSDKILSSDAGFDYHLTKPVLISEIGEVLKAISSRDSN
jgi:CheY-like chemotaxis protein